MKKRFLSVLLIASCFGVVNAQLVVNDNGRVGVGIAENSVLNSSFSVNTVGALASAVYINPNNTNQSTGLYVGRTGLTPLDEYQIGGHFQIRTIAPRKNSIAILSRATSNTLVDGGRSFGIMSYAGNASQGYNYGVFGVLCGTANGAGVYGSTLSEESGTDTGGRYAGFFNGDVHSTGIMTAKEYTVLSDNRLRNSVRSITDSPLDNLMEMRVVKYNYTSVGATRSSTSRDSDTLSTARITLSEEELRNLNVYHYGLVAEELQTIYPDLVKEGSHGYLAINYIELIPLLIHSVQELKAELDASKSGAKKAAAATRSVEEEESTAIDAVVTALYQNEPNPFTESTLIRCDVAEDVVKADLYIYTMNGEQLAEYAVAERGETSVTIDGGSLSAGMYLYALIADGKVVDTKRMVLTK